MKKSSSVIQISFSFLIGMVCLFTQCSDLDIASDSGDSALSGSYARMLKIEDRLYVIGRSSLRVLDTSDPSNPVHMKTISINATVESLFRNKNYLFVGSRESMFIYQLDTDGIPQLASETSYQAFFNFSCFDDPIVSNDTMAYVTLSQSLLIEGCGTTRTNELKIYNIEDITQPRIVNEIPMQGPKGLGLDGDYLFICEEFDGIVAFDVSDPQNVEQIYQSERFQAVDLIPANGNLIVIGVDTLYQYDYTDINNITRTSAFSTKD